MGKTMGKTMQNAWYHQLYMFFMRVISGELNGIGIFVDIEPIGSLSWDFDFDKMKCVSPYLLHTHFIVINNGSISRKIPFMIYIRPQ